jgi:SlyX protein
MAPDQDSIAKLQQRLEDLEYKLAFQQRLLDQLNQVVTGQNLESLKLETLVKELIDQQHGFRASLQALAPNIPHEKPPHY